MSYSETITQNMMESPNAISFSMAEHVLGYKEYQATYHQASKACFDYGINPSTIPQLEREALLLRFVHGDDSLTDGEKLVCLWTRANHVLNSSFYALLIGGDLRAAGHRDHPTAPPEWIQSNFWKYLKETEVKNQVSGEGVVYWDVKVFDRERLPNSISDDKPAKLKSRGGRPSDYDWLAAHKELLRHAALDGLTTKLALRKHLEKWFANRSEYPSLTTLKDKITEWWPDDFPEA